jgi:sugar-specific transcriptional regulator TrmB
MNIQESLKKLGLSERESRVYQELLKIGPTTITNLIKDTGIPSSKIYDILERLLQKGLATQIIVKGKREFHPANPEKLFNLIKEKEEVINEILPNLKNLYEKTNQETIAEIYKGKEGAKAIFEDILNEGKDWLSIGASAKSEIVLPYYMENFYKRLKSKKITLKSLFVQDNETIKLKSKLKDYKNIQIKFLPKEIKNLMSVFIYSDKIAIIPITSDIEINPLIILVKSKESADSYRDYFNWLWKLC